MKLLTSLRLELIKIYFQRGTYVGYAILAAITFLTIWGMYRFHPEREMGRQFGQEMVVGGKMMSAVTPVRYVMAPALFVLIPMLVAAVAGGLVAGEAKAGVLRTWLCRPVSRLTVLTAKHLAAWLHAASLVLFLGLVALGLGYAFFGGGDLVDVRSGDGLVILDEKLALVRLALAYGLAALLMCAIASLALLFSVLFENPMVAAASTIAFLPVATILGNLEYFEFLKPYLLTTYLDFWRPAFKAELDPTQFQPGLSCLAGYCVIPYIVGSLVFWRKDITS